MTEKEKRLAEKNGTLEKMYGQKVNILIRQKYSQDVVESILNNYMANPENPKYIQEFRDLQEYRTLCKEIVKKEVYGE